MSRKVMVSGCWDIVHPGHVMFLQAAAKFGELHVSVASDDTIGAYKERPPMFPQDSRLLHVSALRCVHNAFIATGSGPLDFWTEFFAIRPDVFVVNDDGDLDVKRTLVEANGAEYIVLHREYDGSGIPLRSSTAARKRLGVHV